MPCTSIYNFTSVLENLPLTSYPNPEIRTVSHVTSAIPATSHDTGSISSKDFFRRPPDFTRLNRAIELIDSLSLAGF